MPRKVRNEIDSRTNRLRLAPRKKPYSFASVGPGIALGYRRTTKGGGRWVVRCADGKGGNWQKVLTGCADDHETADGDHVLDFHQAADRARALARGKDGPTDTMRPVTVAEALDAFERDLLARDGLASNARRVRRHLSPTLASKPVSVTTHRDYRAFRDGMLAQGLKPSSAVRLAKSLAAALTLAASLDPRITNRAAWREGLGGLADSHVARKVKLPDADVLALITAAYEIDHALGLLCETLAVTGARPVQLERAVVADLQDDRPDPRIMLPSVAQGPAQETDRAQAGGDHARLGREAPRCRRATVADRSAVVAVKRQAVGRHRPARGVRRSGRPRSAQGRHAVQLAACEHHPAFAGERADARGRGLSRHVGRDAGAVLQRVYCRCV